MLQQIYLMFVYFFYKKIEELFFYKLDCNVFIDNRIDIIIRI
jgi:hypothetical protein